jgi:hypothetical protein
LVVRIQTQWLSLTGTLSGNVGDGRTVICFVLVLSIAVNICDGSAEDSV